MSKNLGSHCSEVSWGTGLAKWEQTCFASRSVPICPIPHTPNLRCIAEDLYRFFGKFKDEVLLTQWHKEIDRKLTYKFLEIVLARSNFYSKCRCTQRRIAEFSDNSKLCKSSSFNALVATSEDLTVKKFEIYSADSSLEECANSTF